MLALATNWDEITAISTAILAVGLLGGFGAAAFAAQQVREERRSREAQMAAEFFRRWNEDALVQTRRLVARYHTPEELSDAYVGYVAADAPEAYVLYPRAGGVPDVRRSRREAEARTGRTCR